MKFLFLKPSHELQRMFNIMLFLSPEMGLNAAWLVKGNRAALFSMLALWNEFIHKVVRKWQTREVGSGTRLTLRWMFLKGDRLHVLTYPHQTWPWSPGEVEWKSPDRQSCCLIQWYIWTVLLTLSLGQNQKLIHCLCHGIDIAKYYTCGSHWSSSAEHFDFAILIAM